VHFCKHRQQPRGFSADVQHLAGASGDFAHVHECATCHITRVSHVTDECSIDDDLDEKAELRRGGALIFEDLMKEVEYGDEYNFLNAFIAARSELFVSVFGGHADFCLHFPGTHIIYKAPQEVMGFTLNGQFTTLDADLYYQNLFSGNFRSPRSCPTSIRWRSAFTFTLQMSTTASPAVF